MGSFLKKIFLPTEQVKDIGRAVKGKKEDKKEEAKPIETSKSDVAEIASLKDEIAQLKAMIMQMAVPSAAVSSSSYDLDAQRRALGFGSGVGEPAFKISGR